MPPATPRKSHEVPILQTRSLREQVYDYLRGEMNSGGLQPGSFVDLNALAQRLGISRTPLRDALLQLEVEGFVEILPRRGFRLKPLSLDEIRNIYQIVGALESAALATAGPKLGKAGLARMKAANRAMRTAIKAEDYEQFFLHNLAFHGETLHNHCHGNTLESGQLFLLDAGAESALHYAGDLTSTFPVDPIFTLRQREVYEIVLAAHMAAVNALKPGIRFREVHLLACRQLAEGLKGLGLMQGDLDEAVALGAHAMFFQCGLGHMMGLDVHDMEDLGEVWVGHEGQPKSTQFGLKSLRLARALEPGFVFTVEPGLYFIPELMDRWRAEGKFRAFINYEKLEGYRGFGGIRIEEDFVMTKQGARMLGPRKPRTAAEVEALRAEP